MVKHGVLELNESDISPSISPEISIVVAVAQNGIIGRDGDMPWRLSTDLKRFKAITMGKPIVMGRKTYESIGKPLPGRPNIVISRSMSESDGVSVCSSIDNALDIARQWCADNNCDEICVIGGGQIYADALPLSSKLYVTHVLAEPDGDTSFPAIADSDWIPVYREEIPIGEKDTAETLYVVDERR